MVELYYQCQSDNGSLTDAHALRQWSTNYLRSLEGIKDPRAPTRLREFFIAAGFTNVEFRMIQLPLCGWSTGKPPFFPVFDCIELLSPKFPARIVVDDVRQSMSIMLIIQNRSATASNWQCKQGKYVPSLEHCRPLSFHKTSGHDHR